MKIINLRNVRMMFNRTKCNFLIRWSSYHWKRLLNLLTFFSFELMIWAATKKSKLISNWNNVAMYVSLTRCVTYWFLEIIDFLIWFLELIKFIENNKLIKCIWSNCFDWFSSKLSFLSFREMTSSLNLIEVKIISFS